MNKANIFLEEFKTSKANTKKPATNTDNPTGEAGSAGGAGGAGAAGATGGILGGLTGGLISGGSSAVMSNSGSNNVEKCPITDDSLYCVISRTAGIVGMVVYIIMILIFFL